MKRRPFALVFILIAALSSVFAQVSPPNTQSRVAGRFVAYNYGTWQIQLQSAPAGTGSQTFSVAASQVRLPDGRVVMPFSTNAPIFVGKEKVTPSAVGAGCINAQTAPGSCILTATFSQLHTTAEYVLPATFGLQEALNDAGASSGGTVTVDSAWASLGGTTAIINAATLPTNTGVEDERGGPGGGGSGTVTSFSAGNLSPLFTTSVATATTTPALSFALSNASANFFLAGPTSGGATTPTYRALVAGDIPTGGATTTNSAFSIAVLASTSGNQIPYTVSGFTINPSTGAFVTPGSIQAGGPGGVVIPAGTQVSPAAGSAVYGSDSGSTGNALVSEAGAAYSRICTAGNAVCALNSLYSGGVFFPQDYQTPEASCTGTISTTTLTVTSCASGTLAALYVITGTGVTPGTQLSSPLGGSGCGGTCTGSGGAGTYAINVSQTASSPVTLTALNSPDNWVNSCITAATGVGGLCDATALSGQTLTWAFNANIVLGSTTTWVGLRLPCSGDWTLNLGGGTNDLLDVNVGSAIYDDCGVEAASGSFFIKNGSAAGGANYGFQTIPPATPGANAWYVMKGFGIGQVSSATGFASGIVGLINAGQDQSEFDLYGLDGSATDTAIFQVTAQNSGTKACCNARLRLFTNSSYTGPTGIAVVGSPTNVTPQAITFEGANSEHPKAGQPNISCTDTNTIPLTTMHIAETLYLELNNTDTSTPAAVQINGCAMFVVDNYVVKAEASGTTRQVFNISNAWNTEVHIGPGILLNASGSWTYPNSQAIVNANGKTIASDSHGNVGAYDSLTTNFESINATAILGPLGTNAVKGVVEGDSSTITCVAGVCSTVGISGSGVVGYSGLPVVSATVYVPLMGDTVGSTTRSNVGWPAPSAAPISSLQAYSSSVPGAGNTLVVTLYDGSTAEALTCTITAAANSCSDMTHSFTPAVGDLMSWQIAPTGTVVITPNIQIGANWATPAAAVPTITYFASTWVGNSSVIMSPTSTNRIQGWAFTTPPTNVTFSNIYLSSHTADANLYSAAIANTSGTLLCHPTTGVAMPTANTLMTNACIEGSVTLLPATTYILLTTGNSSTGAANGPLGTLAAFYTGNVTGCSSASGVISGTCTITLAPAANAGGVPEFLLH